MTNFTLINDTSKPLIFLGSNSNLYHYAETCSANGIKIQGIIDNDYYGNTEYLCDIPVIDTEKSFEDLEKLNYYKTNYNFFCAVNWSPEQLPAIARNRKKRVMFVSLIESYGLNSISLIGKFNNISPSVKIGKGVFVDNMVNIESRVTIGDYVTIYAMTHVGHACNIGKGCVFQRMSVLPSDSTFEDNVYFSPMVKALKGGVTFGENTFIQEGIYIRRGTIKNEIVALGQGNSKRVIPYLAE